MLKVATKYRLIFQNSECVPYQVMPWNIWKAETKILENYSVSSACHNVRQCLETSLCSPLNANRCIETDLRF